MNRQIIFSKMVLMVATVYLLSCSASPISQYSTCKLNDINWDPNAVVHAHTSVDLVGHLPDASRTTFEVSAVNVHKLKKIAVLNLNMSSAQLDKNSYAPDGRLLVFTSQSTLDGNVSSYVFSRDKETPSMKVDISKYPGAYAWLGNDLFARSVGLEIEYWGTDKQVQVCHSKEASDWIGDLRYNSTKGYLAIGADDKMVRLLQVNNGRIFRTFSHEWPTTDLAVDESGQWLATSTSNDKYIMWNVESGNREWEMEYDGAPASAVEFDSTGTTLAIGGWPIRIVNAKTGKTIREMVGSKPTVEQLAFSSSGDMVIAYTNDRISMWRTSDGYLLYELMQPEGVSYFALSPDGRELATTSRDGSEIQIWGVSSE